MLGRVVAGEDQYVRQKGTSALKSGVINMLLPAITGRASIEIT